MKKSFCFIPVISIALILSGCIISRTPSTNSVTMHFGNQKTFSVKVFPSKATYTWTLDGLPLTNTGSSYIYTAQVGEHVLTVRATHILGTDNQTWNIATDNTAPVVNAGPDQNVSVNASVTLNGSGTADADNDIISYHWQQTGGPAVTLNNAGTAIAQFGTAVPIGSVLTFELTVTDAAGMQSDDSCVITVSVISSPINDLLDSMVYLPAGTFMMGSDDDEYGQTSPVHEVSLQGFGIGAYEVTQAQYKAVMGVNPSYYQAPGYPNSENRPVEMVSWDDAREFCTALSLVKGRTFTLPSEAQWEYACRAGTDTLYSFGNDDSILGNYAWYVLNSGNQPHYVGTKLPNAWGLYDMHGNLSEWCLDSWHENYTGAPDDGSAWEPDAGTERVIRDGQYGFSASDLHSARRMYSHKYTGCSGWGFRIVEIP
jgi:formylglycine-generating enzyme required for sulfatase activity